MDTANLRDIFRMDPKKFPDWIYETNVIYRLYNLVTRKSYIGQATSLYGRLIGSGHSHRKAYVEFSKSGVRMPILYRSLLKHKSRSFEVSILESNVTNLNEREKYWIAKLHTYYKDPLGPGYNMTKGGEDASNLHEKEIYDKQRANHGGVLACHTPEARETWRRNREKWLKNPENAKAEHESYKKLFETNRNNHGGVLAWNTPESIQKSLETRRLIYNGDSMGACHTKEVFTRSGATRKLNYIEYMKDPKNVEAEKEACMRQGKVSSVTKLLTSISINISRLKEWKLSVDLDTYLSMGWSKTHKGIHIKRILDKLDILESDERWTQEMSDLFKNLRDKSDQFI